MIPSSDGCPAGAGPRSSMPPARGIRRGCDAVRVPRPSDAARTRRPGGAEPFRRTLRTLRVRRALELIGLAALTVACTQGGSAQPSGTPAPARSPAVTPDPGPIRGERLLVLMDDGNVVVVGADGEDLRRLTD